MWKCRIYHKWIQKWGNGKVFRTHKALRGNIKWAQKIIFHLIPTLALWGLCSFMPQHRQKDVGLPLYHSLSNTVSKSILLASLFQFSFFFFLIFNFESSGSWGTWMIDWGRESGLDTLSKGLSINKLTDLPLVLSGASAIPLKLGTLCGKRANPASPARLCVSVFTSMFGGWARM